MEVKERKEMKAKVEVEKKGKNESVCQSRGEGSKSGSMGKWKLRRK